MKTKIDGMKYESTKENKQRRVKLPKKEARQVLADDPAYRRIFTVLGNKLRQGYTISKLVIRKVNERKDVISIFIYSLGLFISGFFAAKGMRFESLLSLVLAVIISVGIGVKK